MGFEPMDQPNNVASHDDEFLRFATMMNKEMQFKWEFLENPLSDVVEEMKRQMREIDGFKVRVLFLLAEARHHLANASVLKKPPKCSELTDLDRKTMLEARIANEKRLVQILEGTLDLIRDRISMGQTILKDETVQRKTG